MEKDISEMNLLQRLAQVRQIADVAVKDKKGYNYTYAELTQILAMVTAGMNKYGVSLIPNITPGTTVVEKVEMRNTKFDKTGKPYEQCTTEMQVKADMKFTWVNNDNPEDKIPVDWILIGQQADPSQAAGAGLTYFTRYFLINYFQIGQTNNDVDEYRSAQKEAEGREARAVCDEIIDQFDGEVRVYLAQHPDKKEAAFAFISKYVKGANYKSIKEPELASKLKEDFEKEFKVV